MQGSLDSLTSKIEKVLSLFERLDGAVNGGSGGASGGVMNGSLSSIGTPPPPSRAMGYLQMGSAVVSGAAQIGAGVLGMLPSVAETMTRASGFYSAAVMGGGTMGTAQASRFARSNLGLASFASAEVTATLAGRHMMMGGAEMARTMREVQGATTYLNMDPVQAAMAFEGFTSGQGAGNMLRYGVFASNAQGKSRSSTAIMGDLLNRFTGGRKLSVEDTMADLRSGTLGSNIRNSGLSPEQQQLLSQMAIDRARGIKVDYDDPNSVAAARKRNEELGIENPMMSAYELGSKDDELKERATEDYITGIKETTEVLIGLKDKVKEMDSELYKANARIATFMGDNTGSNLVNVLTSALSTAIGVAGAAAAIRGGGRGLLGGGGKATNSVSSTAVGNMTGVAPTVSNAAKPSVGSKLSAGFKATGPLSGALAVTNIALNAPANIEATNQGHGGSAWGHTIGSSVGGIAGAAIGQALIPIPGVGAIIGGMAGSFLGGMAGQGIGSMFDAKPEGGETTNQQAGTTDTGSAGSGSAKPFKLLLPINAKITARYGQKYSSYDPNKLVWPDGHKGVDFAAKEGTPIVAAAEGEAVVTTSAQFGNYVEIKHDNGKYTYYAHMSSAAKGINGTRVTKGQVIGYVGTTGRSSGAHLHFALTKKKGTGNHEDPTPYWGTSPGYEYPAGGGGGEQPAAAAASAGSAADLNQATSGTGTTASQVAGGTSPESRTATSALAGMYGDSGSVEALQGTTGAASSGVSPYSAADYYAGAGASSTTGGNAEGGENANLSPKISKLSKSIAMKQRGGARGGSEGSTTNYVEINLTISSASEDEAIRFAKLVKEKLEEEKMISRMGAR